MVNATSRSVLSVAFLLLAIGCGSPQDPGLVGALSEQTDVIPEQYKFVIPPSARSKLGFSIRVKEGRKITPESVPCFFVIPDESTSLSNLTVSFQASTELKAEVAAAAVPALKAGAKMKNSESIVMTLDELSLREAVGIPNPNGPCVFTKNTSIEVVSGEVVAKTVSLDLSNSLDTTTMANVPVSGAATVGVEAGFQKETDKKLKGRDIVLAALLTNVAVTVTNEEKDLGPTPPIGQSIELPNGISGSLMIKKFNAPLNKLWLTMNAPLGVQVALPKEFTGCELGKEQELELGKQCLYWLPPGNTALEVFWEVKGDRVIVHLKGYQTTFARNKG